MRLVALLAFLTVFAFADLADARGGGRAGPGRTPGAGGGAGRTPGSRPGRNRTGPQRGSQRTRDFEEIQDAQDRQDHIRERRQALDDLDRRATQERLLTKMRTTDAEVAARGEGI